MSSDDSENRTRHKARMYGGPKDGAEVWVSKYFPKKFLKFEQKGKVSGVAYHIYEMFDETPADGQGPIYTFQGTHYASFEDA